jgi:hypothetical protein
MTTSLIKLLVDIETSAVLNPPKSSTFSSKFIHTFNPSASVPAITSKHPFYNSKEKRNRRTLRSKITKILSNLPVTCSKDMEKEHTRLWAENKKKLYFLNSKRESEGKEPIVKLNLSFESDFSGKEYDSPRAVLLKHLSEEELAMFSEDPLYYMYNKKLLKPNVDSNWDELIKNDPRDPDNIKKGLKPPVKIDFLVENRKRKKENKKEKKKSISFNVVGQNSRSILERREANRKIIDCVMKIKAQDKNRVEIAAKSAKILPVLDNRKSLQKNIAEQPKKVDSDEKIEKLEEFLRYSYQVQDNYKQMLVTLAKETKVANVRKHLKKWESKKQSLV